MYCIFSYHSILSYSQKTNDKRIEGGAGTGGRESVQDKEKENERLGQRKEVKSRKGMPSQ